MIALRSIVAKDEAFLRQVYASTRSEEMAMVPWSEDEKVAFLDMQFNAQMHHYLTYYPQATYHVILRDELAIGRLIVQRTADEILLMDIALLPEHRNIGIGTCLMQWLLSESQQVGKPVRLHVHLYDRAIRLYERLGFKTTSQSGIYLEMEWLPPTAAFSSGEQPEIARQ